MGDKRIAPGVYKTDRGFRAFVRVRTAHGKFRLLSKRFPKGAALKSITDWRHSKQIDARTNAPIPEAGTLAADIARYLKQVAAMPTLKWRERDLDAWREKFGDVERSAITPAMIRATLHRWRTEGPVVRFEPRHKVFKLYKQPLSASACNHRRTALLHLYSILDGKDATNPVRAVKPFAEPPPQPRAQDLEFLDAAIGRMKNQTSRTLAQVLMWTGIRGNSELSKMGPAHVDLENAACHVPTGKGGKTLRVVPLTPKGIEAWRAFDALKLWGKKYDRAILRKSVKAGCRAEAKARGIPVPPAVRTYDLRHSIATALLKAGADLADVQDMLGHTTTRMTRRYAPFQRAKLLAAGATVERDLQAKRA